ncbi:dynein intermediate chain 3, ciliary-like [Vanessa cardui]|uniref:dynein intermediate chain 3, ciliary-like n=1 Tax=Vanessa cardui TaxID=171605 RepID=UPI001F1363F0|nr:dynein intermediate chain 3, ciliary-like [Vanessa cardui]
MGTYFKSTYEYTKLRKNFGKQPLFQNVPAHILDSINPDYELQKQYILRNPVHREVQAVSPQTEHDSNTKQVIKHEQGINHTEGGWPRDVHLYNEEHILRHRRRIQHEENYVHSVLNLRPAMEHFIDQNNAIDMYQAYFSDMEPQAPVEEYKVQIANVFRDTFNRPISSIAWTNEKKSKVIASYCYKTYSVEPDRNQNNICYVWDVNRQTSPIYEFSPKSCCWQVESSPVEAEVIVAGLSNGTINIFDIRSSSEPVTTSSIYNSHLGPITALLFTHSRTHTEFFTGSLDGQCLWWDKRNISKPVDQLSMSVRYPADEEPNLTNSEGISSLQFDKGLPTKFLCGTESGLVINANRMGRSHSEILTSYWVAHTGPVRSVHRSPCTLRMFITCGDWNVKIWSEEVRSGPIIVTKPYRHQITDVSWAPLRYSCYMVVAADGVFNYWDLLRKYKQPVASLNISDHGLTKIAPHPEGESIAVGDNYGSLFLLHLSDNMIYPGVNDKQLMHQIYDRETRREHILDARLKEIRLKARMEQEPSIILPEETTDTEDLEAEEELYFKIVKEEINITDGVFPTTNFSDI